MKKKLPLLISWITLLFHGELVAQQYSSTSLPLAGPKQVNQERDRDRPTLLTHSLHMFGDTVALRKLVPVVESHGKAIPAQSLLWQERRPGDSTLNGVGRLNGAQSRAMLSDSLSNVLDKLSSATQQRVSDQQNQLKKYFRYAAPLKQSLVDTAFRRKTIQRITGGAEHLRLPKQAFQPDLLQKSEKEVLEETLGVDALKTIVVQKLSAGFPQLGQQKQAQPNSQLNGGPTAGQTRLDTVELLKLVPTVNKIEIKRLPSLLNNPQQLDSLRNTIKDMAGVTKNKVPTWGQVQLNLPQKFSAVDDFTKGRVDSLAELGLFNKEKALQLPGLPGNVLKTDKILHLDSLRKAHLLAESLQLKEGKMRDDYKEVVLKPKESLLNRSYVEGIVGLGNQLDYLTFSPSVGINMIKALSGGLGVNVGLNTRRFSESPLIGIRSFAKYELIRKRLNIQLENNSYFTKPTPATTLSEGANKGLNHLLYVGAGYLIHYSKSKSINVAALYQLNKNKVSPAFYSPFLLRLGISVFKPALEP